MDERLHHFQAMHTRRRLQQVDTHERENRHAAAWLRVARTNSLFIAAAQYGGALGVTSASSLQGEHWLHFAYLNNGSLMP